MKNILHNALLLFLVAVIFFLTLVIAVFLDYGGFINLRQYIPGDLAQRAPVAEYIRRADINVRAPKDQRTLLLEDKEKYVEELLRKMKVESMRLLTEKETLENLFRQLEEEKQQFDLEKQDYASKVQKYEAERQIQADEQYQKRLDNLAAMYSKMEPRAAAEILRDLSLEMSKEVLARLKPKSLGAILEELPADTRTRVVEMLQTPATSQTPDFISTGT